MMSNKEQEINWNDYVGKVINVKDRANVAYVPRELVGYYPTYDNPFLVEGISGHIIVAYEQAEVIPDEREIDWTKVPKGTLVKCANTSLKAAKWNETRIFLCYADGMYWSYSKEDIAMGNYLAYGFPYCVLDEPLKDEWYREVPSEIEISWKDYEGKDIEVSDTEEAWYVRELIIYNGDKKKPFLCKTINKDAKSWRYARQIQLEDSDA